MKNKRALKRYLMTVNNCCTLCGIEPYWNGKPLVLHIDHINGDSSDHRVENGRLLCPNCHSQTDTYAGKKTKKVRVSFQYECKHCGKAFSSTNSKRLLCSRECSFRQSRKGKFKIDWPSFEDLKRRVELEGYTKTAQKLGVSDVAVHKRLRRISTDEQRTKARAA